MRTAIVLSDVCSQAYITIEERNPLMSHQDDAHLGRNISVFKGVLEAAVPDLVSHFVRHGNAKLDSVWLASVAITCWGWTVEGTLTNRVAAACKVVGRVLNRNESVTRQGLMKALATCGPELVNRMIDALVIHLKSLKGHWTHNGMVNIAVDGSKFAAPRTIENQSYFAATGGRQKTKEYQHAADQAKASTVQVLLTVFWHMRTGLPLRWTISGSYGSERRNAAAMLDELPRNARLIGDAEYVGYPLWSKIIQSGRCFLVRVGSNVTLLKNLGKHQIEHGFVYYWPDHVMNADAPPIVLRLFQIHDGDEALFLVTNELDMNEQTASELYSGRWKVEMFFRTVKQTCEHAKLHCLRPDNVLTELHWILLGIWYALFTGKQALQQQGYSPHKLSPVKVISAFQEVVRTIHRSTITPELFYDQLTMAVLNDETHRTTSKASRNYPRKKKHERPGPPKICSPTPQQQRRAEILRV
jgi:hypothetical protein